mmetsp:Transcript_18556/g.46722  ORF Transcript_18556/g.46722 Transcript_18556/m.46722 type:complete len:302 (-) Transcript_18556:5590-6495(-)
MFRGQPKGMFQASEMIHGSMGTDRPFQVEGPPLRCLGQQEICHPIVSRAYGTVQPLQNFRFGECKPSQTLLEKGPSLGSNSPLDDFVGRNDRRGQKRNEFMLQSNSVVQVTIPLRDVFENHIFLQFSIEMVSHPSVSLTMLKHPMKHFPLLRKGQDRARQTVCDHARIVCNANSCQAHVSPFLFWTCDHPGEIRPHVHIPILHGRTFSIPGFETLPIASQHTLVQIVPVHAIVSLSEEGNRGRDRFRDVEMREGHLSLLPRGGRGQHALQPVNGLRRARVVRRKKRHCTHKQILCDGAVLT